MKKTNLSRIFAEGNVKRRFVWVTRVARRFDIRVEASGMGEDTKEGTEREKETPCDGSNAEANKFTTT